MASEVSLIVQVARGGAAARRFAADPPPSVAGGQVVIDHISSGTDERLGPPEAGEVVMSVLSPEALTRERRELKDVVRRAAAGHEPLVIVVQAAEELREDELAVVLDAAKRAHRQIILRVMSDA